MAQKLPLVHIKVKELLEFGRNCYTTLLGGLSQEDSKTGEFTVLYQYDYINNGNRVTELIKSITLENNKEFRDKQY